MWLLSVIITNISEWQWQRRIWFTVEKKYGKKYYYYHYYYDFLVPIFVRSNDSQFVFIEIHIYLCFSVKWSCHVFYSLDVGFLRWFSSIRETSFCCISLFFSLSYVFLHLFYHILTDFEYREQFEYAIIIMVAHEMIKNLRYCMCAHGLLKHHDHRHHFSIFFLF